MDTAIAGFLAGLGLIVAIGAQNAFVLRQGLRRQAVGVVVPICAVSDALLVTLGTVGIGVLVTRFAWVLVVLTWGGVAYLCWFAYRSFRSAAKPASLSAERAEPPRGVVLTTLALTFLNPHVYLDTVVMLGTLANRHADARWVFAAGAATASLVWFSALGFGARALSGPLGRPAVWRVLDVLIGIVMLAIAARLALGALGV